MSKRDKPRKGALNIASTVFLLLAVLILIGSVIFAFGSNEDRFIFGYKPFIISTGSMEPEYSTYAIVIIRQDDFDVVKINDVVAFKSKQLGGSGAMHRVVEKTEHGYITKGDNNKYPDEEYLTAENYVGREVWYTNAFAGYIARFMQPYGWLMYLLIPLVGIIILIIALRILIVQFKSNKNEAAEILDQNSADNEIENKID